MSENIIFRSLLLKIASACNLKCKYCYWFKDKSIYDKPPLLTPEAENSLVERLESHIIKNRLDKFEIIFHGGEPLLFGKKRFVRLMKGFINIAEKTGCMFTFSITTNGTLIDKEWAKLFRIFKMNVALSIDGPKEINDKYRIDFAGHGSYDNIIRGLTFLRRESIEPGVLAVCDPRSDPQVITQYFVDVLRVKNFDILIPDANYESGHLSIATYYKKLFDLWFDIYSSNGVNIRLPNAMLKNLLGGNSHSDSIGYAPIQTVTMLTDGSLEPLDVLRFGGCTRTNTGINIQTHSLQDVVSNPVWREAYNGSLSLCSTCKSCEYYHACGGGYLPHRWSNINNYDNPSVYCKDLKEMFGHIWNRVIPEIKLVAGNRKFSFPTASREIDHQDLIKD